LCLVCFQKDGAKFLNNNCQFYIYRMFISPSCPHPRLQRIGILGSYEQKKHILIEFLHQRTFTH
jgi:hypothetical protein